MKKILAIFFMFLLSVAWVHMGYDDTTSEVRPHVDCQQDPSNPECMEVWEILKVLSRN